ncbi:MAG: hypothetical protein U0401_04490 [Anaerolineae bacterium]
MNPFQLPLAYRQPALLAAVLSFLLMLLLAGLTLAQSGGTYELAWASLTNVDGASSNGGYSLQDATCQFAPTTTGGQFTLSHCLPGVTAAVSQNQNVYLPLILK